MKILFFSRLFHPHIGGVEKHVEEISKILTKKGHTVAVLTEKFDNSLPENEIVNGIKIIRIDNGKNDWFEKFRVWTNVWANRQSIIDADVIHIHDVFFWYLPFRFIFLTKKIFITFHGYEGNSIPGLKSKLMHKIAEKLSNGNICVGVFLKKWYGTKPDYVIYGGVNVVEINNQKSKIKNTNQRLKILFLGRLEEETGIIEYLKALALLRKEVPGFELIVVGDGSLMRKAMKLASKNKIQVKFEGFQKNIEKYLAECDFVFTSRYLGILEALSFKKFIFAVYNNPIKKDYIGMSPFAKYISTSGNSKKLSDQLGYILQNTRRKDQMVNQGFNWVKNQTWGIVASAYLKLWENN